MTAAPNIPLSSQDPRYRELLLRGSREEFEVECESPNQAIRLRYIIQSFRSRLRKEHGEENQEAWLPLYGCIISIPKDHPQVLIFRPRHGEFDSVLSKVTKPAPVLKEDPLKDL